MSELAVFLSVAILDALWTLYIRATSKGSPFRAAMWSAGIMTASAFSATLYVNSPSLIPYAVLGAFVGTYLVLRIGYVPT